MSRRPDGERALTPAERQRKRRARLAAERPPKRDIRVDKLSRLLAEVERLRAELGMHDPRDVEMSRLQAEVARLQAEVAQWRAMAGSPSRPAMSPPHNDADDELRRQVKRLRREADGLKAQHRAMCDDGTLVRIMRRTERMAKSVLSEDALNAKWLLKDIHSSIGSELERRRKACATIDRKVEKLAAIAPDKATELRRKIEMLANDPGATDDERAAAAAALAKLTTGVQ
jgi:hypothetical protein